MHFLLTRDVKGVVRSTLDFQGLGNRPFRCFWKSLDLQLQRFLIYSHFHEQNTRGELRIVLVLFI